MRMRSKGDLFGILGSGKSFVEMKLRKRRRRRRRKKTKMEDGERLKY